MAATSKGARYGSFPDLFYEVSFHVNLNEVAVNLPTPDCSLRKNADSDAQIEARNTFEARQAD